MKREPARCLILACGNTLRGDDGIGPFLAAWAEERFASEPNVEVVARQQWTPELAEEISRADSVLFIDCSVDLAAGAMALSPVIPAAAEQGLATHHLGAVELLALAKEFYDSLPSNALQLTIGAGSLELSEELSPAVTKSLSEARRLLEETVLRLLTIP